MKRASAVLIVLGSLFLHPAAAHAAEGCTLNAVQGDVKIVHDGATIEGRPGSVVQKSDQMVVAPGAQADMSMNDLAGIRVLGGSQIKVEGWKPANMAVKVETGNVILNLKELPKGSSFQVQTPTAVATVRGTQFWGRVETAATDHPVTTFAVRDGSVEITDLKSSRTFTLEKGQAIDITKLTGSYAVRSALAEEMAAMEQADSIPTGVTA